MENSKPTLVNYSIRCGLLGGLYSIVYYLIGYGAHWLSDPYWTLIYYVILVGLSIYFVIKFRNKIAEGCLNFKSAFNLSFIIFVISGTLFSIFSSVFQTYLSPETGQLLLKEAEQKLIDQGMEPEQIASNLQLTQWMLKYPALSIGIGIAGSVLIGAVLSLIVAPLTRKEHQLPDSHMEH